MLAREHRRLQACQPLQRGCRARRARVVTVTAHDDILIGRLAADLQGTGRVDLALCDADGIERLRLPDIPHHHGTSGALFQESITHAKALPTSTMIVRLVRVDEEGGEYVLGEYTFHHTRSLPGPGTVGPAE